VALFSPYDCISFLHIDYSDWLSLALFLPYICKHSSRFINSCFRSRYNCVRSIALHSIFHGKYYSPLGRNLRICCRRFGWQLEDFLLGFVSLNDDCFHNFCMNNIPLAQLQIASLVEELLSLREGFVTFHCGNFLWNSDIIVLLNAACIEWWRRVTSIEKFSLYFLFFLHFNLYTALSKIICNLWFCFVFYWGSNKMLIILWDWLNLVKFLSYREWFAFFLEDGSFLIRHLSIIQI